MDMFYRVLDSVVLTDTDRISGIILQCGFLIVVKDTDNSWKIIFGHSLLYLLTPICGQICIFVNRPRLHNIIMMIHRVPQTKSNQLNVSIAIGSKHFAFPHHQLYIRSLF
jgi:hypothetical protein